MRFGKLPRTTRRVLMLFLAVTIVPATALGWLSWKLIEQDRELETRRMKDRLDSAADRIVTSLDHRLTDLSDRLAGLVGSSNALPADALLVSFGVGGIQAHPGKRLLYYPAVIASRQDAAIDALFEPGEAFEVQKKYGRAISVFRDASLSKEPSVRAGALIRLARSLWNNDQPQDALDVYSQLQRLDTVLIDGWPADLLARKGRCLVLAGLQRYPDLQREALMLRTEIQEGRWHLDRADRGLVLEELQRWLPAELQPPPASETEEALAESVEWFWSEWQQIPHDLPNLTGHKSLWNHGKPVLVVWSGTAENLTVLFAGSGYLESQLASAWTGSDVAGFRVSLDADSHDVFGSLPSGALSAVRKASETRLPWTIRVAGANPAADSAEYARRRRLLLTGLSIMSVLTLMGGYWTARAAAREFALARLQTDFVSAVSHEFRTPLTSLRQLTELLASGSITNEDRRRQYYDVLARESERLHRLVEGLLDFGSGRPYTFESVEPVEFLEQIVTEFQSDVRPSTHRIELTANGLRRDVSTLQVNREALSRAVRNLLENAVKYSPGCPAVRVALECKGNRLAVRIHDDGFGVPASEQRTIFDKFVRGAASRALNIRGTGIGLAMAQHIVQAHNGEILLESEPGRGTTFTIELPLTELSKTPI